MNINVRVADINLTLFKKCQTKSLQYAQNVTKKKLKKLVTSAGFKLKGTGWYETDFKNKKKEKKTEKQQKNK